MLPLVLQDELSITTWQTDNNILTYNISDLSCPENNMASLDIGM